MNHPESPHAFHSSWQPASESIVSSTYQINTTGLMQLYRDEPSRRRKVYLQFEGDDQQGIMQTLAKAGIETETVKTRACLSPEGIPSRGCLVIGSAASILKLLDSAKGLRHASVDLPEYSWMSYPQDALL